MNSFEFDIRCINSMKSLLFLIYQWCVNVVVLFLLYLLFVDSFEFNTRCINSHLLFLFVYNLMEGHGSPNFITYDLDLCSFNSLKCKVPFLIKFL